GYFFEEAISQTLIDLPGGTQDLKIDSILAGEPGERLHICLSKDSPHTGAWLQTAWRDFFIEAEGERKADGICTHVLAQAGDFIDEGNFSSDEGGRRLAGQFSSLVVSHQYWHTAHYQWVENLFERGDGFTR